MYECKSVAAEAKALFVLLEAPRPSATLRLQELILLAFLRELQQLIAMMS